MNTTDAHHSKNSKIRKDLDFNICSCGYPRIPNTYVCPFCGKNDNDVEEKSEESNSDAYLVLKPFGEFIELYPEITISEHEKVLVKNDIDDTDSYLSSKGHVRLKRKDEQWIIENMAPNKAVFLRIEKSMPLKNGDVILLGKNRLYQVNIK